MSETANYFFALLRASADARVGWPAWLLQTYKLRTVQDVAWNAEHILYRDVELLLHATSDATPAEQRLALAGLLVSQLGEGEVVGPFPILTEGRKKSMTACYGCCYLEHRPGE